MPQPPCQPWPALPQHPDLLCSIRSAGSGKAAAHLMGRDAARRVAAECRRCCRSGRPGAGGAGRLPEAVCARDELLDLEHTPLPSRSLLWVGAFRVLKRTAPKTCRLDTPETWVCRASSTSSVCAPTSTTQPSQRRLGCTPATTNGGCPGRSFTAAAFRRRRRAIPGGRGDCSGSPLARVDRGDRHGD